MAKSNPAVEHWQPAQVTQPEAVDFRNAKTGPKGYKERNKRKQREEEVEHQDEDLADTSGAPAPEPMAEDAPSTKRRKSEGAHYIPIYERVVKAPAQRASKVMKANIKTSWDKKMQEKATRQQLQEAKKEALTIRKDKKKADVAHRKAVKERKEANKAKSVVVQKITNNATLKKMMKNKKQKKLLKTADTNP